MTEPLVQARQLTKHYVLRGGLFSRRQVVRALHWVDLTVYPGETFGVVGESGCGKTTLGRCLLRLVEPTFGEVLFRGENLLQLDRETLRQRRRYFQMLFQNPYLSLDPRMNVLNLVGEPLVTHTDLRGRALAERVAALLERVGLSADHLYRYPHEFSGGQLQRIAIARALALNPLFVVLDEPTSALDVSVQAQFLNLLKELQAELGLTYLFISHDLSVIYHVSDRVAVMYLGQVVEEAPTDELFSHPLHPYTQALLAAIPSVDPAKRRQRIILEGTVPSPIDPPRGCRFHPRCFARKGPLCAQEQPPSVEQGGHRVACHLYA
jgi:oligopeptide/dipeptide ABC transporter ATP-binding protein